MLAAVYSVYDDLGIPHVKERLQSHAESRRHEREEAAGR